jgi:hypothetical protein
VRVRLLTETRLNIFPGSCRVGAGTTRPITRFAYCRACVWLVPAKSPRHRTTDSPLPDRFQSHIIGQGHISSPMTQSMHLR